VRALLVSLLVFGLGLASAVLVVSPHAGTQTTAVDGTLTGSVGTSGNPNAFAISLSASTVPAGQYELDITDWATVHNFDLCAGSTCTGSNSIDATDIAGTGSVQWIVDLAPGTYFYQCDAHHSLHGTLTVTGPGTTTTQTTQTTQTTTAALGVHITSTHATRTLVKVSAQANQLSRVTAVLLRRGKRLARTATDGMHVSLRLRPAHRLTPGRYVVKVTVKCCGTSATAKKTIRVT
jgi:hypothetical protein